MFWYHSWRLKIFSGTFDFDFECTYIKEVQYNCSAHHSVQLFVIEISSYSHKEQKEPQFFFSNFSSHSDWIQKDTNMARYLYSVRMWEMTCKFVKKRLLYRCFSCEYCKIFNNNFFYRTPVAVSKSRGIFSNHANI